MSVVAFKTSKQTGEPCMTFSDFKGLYRLEHKYRHLLIFSYNFERLCLTRECQQTLIWSKVILLRGGHCISKSPILH